MIPPWLHLDWFLFGLLTGWTLTSVFTCWLLERRDRRTAWDRRVIAEQDATLRGLYQQTSRLAQLVVHHAPAPDAPHHACRIVWPRQES